MTWFNIDIFCFKLLRHIKGDHFRSLRFSSMNLQYTAALGCMSLNAVSACRAAGSDKPKTSIPGSFNANARNLSTLANEFRLFKAEMQ